MPTTIKHYKQLERRIKKDDRAALVARWAFGRALLKERGDKKRLPNGRLEELANALASSPSELKNRMQFGEEHSTKAEVFAAFEKHGSWSEICARGLGARYANDCRQQAEDAREEAELGRIRAEAALDARDQTGELFRGLRVALVDAHNALVDLKPHVDVSELFALLEQLDAIQERVFGEWVLRVAGVAVP